MNFRPEMASALIGVPQVDSDRLELTGSGASFGLRNLILTANHCVPETGDLAVQFHAVPPTHPVLHVERLPEADLALLRIAPMTGPPEVMEFWNAQCYQPPEYIYEAGTDVRGWGYPVHTTEWQDAFARRLFKGHVQGMAPYTFGDKHYLADELSFAVPQGASGTVIAPVQAPQVAVGVLTTNVRSDLVVDSYEDKNDQVLHKLVRVVEYGLASPLIHHQEWYRSFF